MAEFKQGDKVRLIQKSGGQLVLGYWWPDTGKWSCYSMDNGVASWVELDESEMENLMREAIDAKVGELIQWYDDDLDEWVEGELVNKVFHPYVSARLDDGTSVNVDLRYARKFNG